MYRTIKIYMNCSPEQLERAYKIARNEFECLEGVEEVDIERGRYRIMWKINYHSKDTGIKHYGYRYTPLGVYNCINTIQKSIYEFDSVELVQKE